MSSGGLRSPEQSSQSGEGSERARLYRLGANALDRQQGERASGNQAFRRFAGQSILGSESGSDARVFFNSENRRACLGRLPALRARRRVERAATRSRVLDGSTGIGKWKTVRCRWAGGADSRCPQLKPKPMTLVPAINFVKNSLSGPDVASTTQRVRGSCLP